MSVIQPALENMWSIVAAFIVAALLVWSAGTRLTGYVDQIAGATGLNRAFMGMLLLGGITSLPEVAAIGTSAATGNAALAVNNLFGSVSINVLLIAIADVLLGREAITSTVPSSATIMQGCLGMLVLALSAVAILSGDAALGWVGLWPVVLFISCIGAFWLSARYATRAPWRVAEQARPKERDSSPEEGRKRKALPELIGKTAMAAAFILVGGFVLAQSGDALAEKTGIGSGLIGLVLVGFATSLPEVSTITEAVRRKRYEMALGDIFGTNLLTVGLILIADLLYMSGPILSEAGIFEAVASLLGLILTGIFLVGLLERADRTILRMGYDALAALAVFPLGLVLLYFLQGR